MAVLYVLRPPAEASSPIEAIPLEITTAENIEISSTTTDTTEATTVATDSVVADVQQESATGEVIASEAPAVVEETAAVETVDSGGLTIYQISSADSLVSFELDEDLRSNRVTVVGTTDQVAGELAVDFSDLSQTQVGVIQINARTLVTDNSNRNRAMQNEILDTGSYEFITFNPTSVTGLPESVVVGDTITFIIEGDLTIRDVTLPVTFSVEATAVSATQISGSAETSIVRSDYGLSIPSVPGVANVDEEVTLSIYFAANAVE
jgi:polyisoprenoid-binding protein YceI